MLPEERLSTAASRSRVHLMPIGIPFLLRFDPDLVARFDSATADSNVLAFNNMRNSLRIGPEMALNILPDPGYASRLLSRFSALFGYNICQCTPCYQGEGFSGAPDG